LCLIYLSLCESAKSAVYFLPRITWPIKLGGRVKSNGSWIVFFELETTRCNRAVAGEIRNILQIKSGRVEIRKENGSLVRTIGNGDAVAADFNNDQSLLVITTVKGKVERRKENGSLIR
jgi:hypothetical protein